MQFKILHKDIQFTIVIHLSSSYSRGTFYILAVTRKSLGAESTAWTSSGATGSVDIRPSRRHEQREYRRHPRNFSTHIQIHECTAALHKQEGRSLSSTSSAGARLTMLAYSCILASRVRTLDEGTSRCIRRVSSKSTWNSVRILLEGRRRRLVTFDHSMTL